MTLSSRDQKLGAGLQLQEQPVIVQWQPRPLYDLQSQKVATKPAERIRGSIPKELNLEASMAEKVARMFSTNPRL